MALSDPIADLLTRLRNAKEAKHRFVNVRYSKIKAEIARVLKETGYVENYLINEEKHLIRVYLRYANNRDPVIQGLKRVSRPGARYYVGVDEIPTVLGGMGIAVLSTPKGIISGQSAKQQKVGGELLCKVW